MGRPIFMVIGGQRYKAVVMKVITSEEGRPRVLQALYDEESTKIQGGEEFVTVYMPSNVIRKGN